MFNPISIIEKKKQGGALSTGEISWMVSGFLSDSVKNYQMSALLMAIYFQGMDERETADLTAAMLVGGKKLDLSSLARPKVDKHSTGGVGDKVSIALAPLAASMGMAVPMLSGRSLGHTGGTLDKLEAIPGYRTCLKSSEMRVQIERIGCFISGQTREIAPVDRKLYALRDVTGTVDCVPLITSSILSKKLSEGIDSLVMDVKYGSGAFMPTLTRARTLAKSLAATGHLLGLEVRTLLTSMDQPLGWAVGNSLEIIETVHMLQGSGPPDLLRVTKALAVEMALSSRLVPNEREATRRASAVLSSGAALERFKEWIAFQGGRLDYRKSDLGLDVAPLCCRLEAHRSGYVRKIKAREVGLTVIDLGGGRIAVEDKIDPGVGLLFEKKAGTRVKRGDPIVAIYARDEVSGAHAMERLRAAITISPKPPARTQPLVRRFTR